MKLRKPFSRLIFDDFPAKILCVVLAVVFYYIFRLNSLESKNFTSILNIVDDGSMCVASTIDPRIKVTLYASKETISAINESGVSVKIDISHYTESGEYDVPVFYELSDELLLIDPLELKIEPSHIPIKLEKSISKSVRVEAQSTGSPAHGYELKALTVSPDYLNISGPESMVNSIDFIQTNPISIASASRTVTQTVKLLQKNRIISVEDNIDSVSVSAGIVPIVSTRLFQSKKIEARALSSDFIITNVLEPVDISLKGNLLALEGIKEDVALVYVDCSGINKAGEYELPVRVLLPSGTAVISQSVEKISLSVAESYSFRQRQIEKAGALEQSEVQDPVDLD